MNCKQGDLAIVIYGGNGWHGRLVEVLYPSPTHASFTLPDGYPHAPASPNSWVVRSLGSPFPAPTEGGTRRKTMFGSAIDAALRPLPGISEDKALETERISVSEEVHR